MNIGDRVQTFNTLCPISGTIVEMYDNLIIISDDDAETDDDNELCVWGDGDSLDRERVRDILLEEYNYKFVGE